jgi:transcriptional regulator with XRE-family HTH domain
MHSQVVAQSALTLDPALMLRGAIEMATKAGGKASDTLGRRIARLRRDRGLTQVELAERLGVTQPAVSDYENDDIRLPADVVIQIARILGVSTDELLGLKETQAAPGASRNRRLYRRLQEIEKLPRRDQQALLRTIEAFISKVG